MAELFSKFSFLQVHARLLGVSLEQLDDAVQLMTEWDDDHDQGIGLGYLPNKERIDVTLQIRRRVLELKTEIDTLLLEKEAPVG